MRIAYLGPEGTYTHQAALSVARIVGSNAKLQPERTIEDVFVRVQQGEADKGIVPFENSSNGSVAFTLDLFADFKNQYADIHVIDEAYVPVQHCLVGHNRQSQDKTTGNDLSWIKKLYSHPQAWSQCDKFLDSHLLRVSREDASSTSQGAKTVAAEGPDSTSAAISSRLAAELAGIDILVDGIEDIKGNTTRFFVIQKGSQDSKTISSSQYKTMVSFTIEHTKPGALADALAVFKKHDINLTNLATRPRQQPWMYIFFVEFLGYRGQPTIDTALEELQQFSQTYRWLGSWKSAL